MLCVVRTYIGLIVLAYVVDDDDSFRIRMIAGCIVAVIVVLSAIIILTVVYLRSKSNDECNKKQPSDCDTLEYRNGEGKSVVFLGDKILNCYINKIIYKSTGF